MKILDNFQKNKIFDDDSEKRNKVTYFLENKNSLKMVEADKYDENNHQIIIQNLEKEDEFIDKKNKNNCEKKEHPLNEKENKSTKIIIPNFIGNNIIKSTKTIYPKKKIEKSFGNLEKKEELIKKLDNNDYQTDKFNFQTTNNFNMNKKSNNF